jgi:hypothetical protein
VFRFTGDIVLESELVFGVDAFQSLELAFRMVGFWMDMISKNDGWSFPFHGAERGGFPLANDLSASADLKTRDLSDSD